MTVRQVIQCEVCGATTLLRTQLGWLRQHPIRIPCGRCGITIFGEVNLFPERAGFDFKFKNGRKLEDMEASDYYLECSGELLTDKLQSRASLQPGADFIPPFFTSQWAMGIENFLKFKQRAIHFLSACADQWPIISRANQLWLGGQHDYLRKELRPLLNNKAFPVDKGLEYLRGIHQVNLLFTLPINDSDQFEAVTEFLWSEFHSLVSNHKIEVISLARTHSENGILKDYCRRFLNVMERMVTHFPHLIPVFGLRFYKRSERSNAESKGITTATFDELKQFYIDCYEDGAEMLLLLAALNNLKHRGDSNAMQPIRRDVATLNDFSKLSKGNRIQFFGGGEDFDWIIRGCFAAGIRNAIGHSSYRYDVPSQVITYYPKGTLGVGKEEAMTLLEFAQLCWQVFQAHISLNELCYQLEKIYWVSLGQKPVLPSIVKRAMRQKKSKAKKAKGRKSTR